MTNDERDNLIKATHDLIVDIDKRLTVNDKETKELRTAVFGNGRPGLKERVQTVEDCHYNKKASKACVTGWILALAAILGAGSPYVIAFFNK